MKRVLIAGAGSYIGMQLAAHLLQSEKEYEVRELDVQKPFDSSAFSGWDVVVHVAGIAHQRETAENAPLYQAVNCDLALEAARMAKAQGVKQFIFLSSMSVYGLTHGHITAQTQPAPTTHYGKSKWTAEQGLQQLADEAFRVAVLRPPMVYGRGCRGNYPRLSALAQSLPLFPNVQNQRSMVYIGTLCACIQWLMDEGQEGLFFPQNRDYVCTAQMVREIARCHGRRVRLVPGFGWLIRWMAGRISTVDKLFGDLTYDQALSAPVTDEMDFAETIRLTEVGS